jgi:hypothetical protein
MPTVSARQALIAGWAQYSDSRHRQFGRGGVWVALRPAFPSFSLSWPSRSAVLAMVGTRG